MKTAMSFVFIIALFVASSARSQFAPLHVGMTNGVVDEFGAPLKGTTPAAPDVGMPYVQGEIVQILIATNGVFPPDINGNPDPNNTLLHEMRIGEGLDPYSGAKAQVGAAVPGRPDGKSVIARVFNKSSLGASSFYGDSQVFYVSKSGDPTPFNSPFIPSIQLTDKPMDSGDGDGDGLIGSWEKSIGTSTNNPDTDGDGIGDGAEFRSGTDGLDGLEYLKMVELDPEPGDNLNVSWDSVPGRAYQLQYLTGNLDNPTNVFYDVNTVITANTLVTWTTITNALLTPNQHFRVRLVETNAP